jgi:hypothetical protein
MLVGWSKRSARRQGRGDAIFVAGLRMITTAIETLIVGSGRFDRHCNRVGDRIVSEACDREAGVEGSISAVD